MKFIQARSLKPPSGTRQMDKFECDNCKKTFSSRGNLNRHVTSAHTDIWFKCDVCRFMFKTKGSLLRHIGRKHPSPGINKGVKCIKCLLCSETRQSKPDIVEHYVSQHEIVMQRETLDFPNEEEFYNWKRKTEKEQVCEFIISRSKTTLKSDCSSRMSFTCHRDGAVRARGKNIRRIKRAGSNKINGHCPAKLDVVFHTQGRIAVHYCKTHVGHAADSRRMRLTRDEKYELFGKPTTKVPLDNVRDSRLFSGKDHHLDLLPRKDPSNSEQQCNLKLESDKSDTSVEAWIQDMEELVENHAEENSNSERNLVIEGIPNLIKQNVTKNVLQHELQRYEDKEQIKAKLKQCFEDIVDKYDSDEDIEIIDSLLQQFVPTLKARKLKRALPPEEGPSKTVTFAQCQPFSKGDEEETAFNSETLV